MRDMKGIFDLSRDYSPDTVVTDVVDDVIALSKIANDNSQKNIKNIYAELAAMEAADQLARIEKAVGEGEVPAGSLMELAGVLASFRSRPAFVREFVRERKREALGNPDMAVRMKTLDSDRLNAVFEQLSGGRMAQPSGRQLTLRLMLR